MPLIQVKLVEGVFSDAQKKEMIRGVTDAMVAIEGEAMRNVTWVVIEEVKSGSWGIGGEAMTTADIRAMAGFGALPQDDQARNGMARMGEPMARA